MRLLSMVFGYASVTWCKRRPSSAYRLKPSLCMDAAPAAVRAGHQVGLHKHSHSSAARPLGDAGDPPATRRRRQQQVGRAPRRFPANSGRRAGSHGRNGQSSDAKVQARGAKVETRVNRGEDPFEMSSYVSHARLCSRCTDRAFS